MKVSGFTAIKNAVRLDFPVVECIRSILPLVDEFIVVLGDSDDGTEELLKTLDDPRVRIVKTEWNPNVGHGGFTIAQQTTIGLLMCTGKWAIHIQADETIHEKDHAHIRRLMEKYQDDDGVESLSLHRTHFYGDYQTYMLPADDLCVRIVKPHRFVLSRGDAAGFTVHPKYKERGRRITTLDTGVMLYHYFSLRKPDALGAKLQAQKILMDGEETARFEETSMSEYYRFYPKAFLHRFDGSHPAAMQDRIATYPFRFDHGSPDIRSRLTFRERRALVLGFLDRYVSRIFRVGMRSSRLVATERPPLDQAFPDRPG
jgi:glycosyltransferase involved in cell wall biosynthesis